MAVPARSGRASIDEAQETADAPQRRLRSSDVCLPSQRPLFPFRSRARYLPLSPNLAQGTNNKLRLVSSTDLGFPR